MPLISSACDKSPCWICWAERIRGASGCWCLTWQSNTERWFPCFHGQVLHTGITTMCYMCCCRCKSLAKVRLKITTQEKCNIWCWHSHRKIKQADFINFALVCRPFGSQKTPSNQVERANGLTKTTAAHFTRSPLLSRDNLPSWAYKVTKSKKNSTGSWRHLQKNEKKTKLISYQGVFLRMYTRPEHVPLSKVKLELRTYLCVIDLWLCVFGSYCPSFAGMQIRGTAPTS